MYSALTFRELFELISLFQTHPFGIAHDLLHYFAIFVRHLSNYDFEGMKRMFRERRHPDHIEIVGIAPQDVSIMKKRASLTCINNEAYAILLKEWPTVIDLERFGEMMAYWSVLYAIKMFLMDHVELERRYRGFLPFGSEVIKFVNSLRIYKPIGSTPDFADHVFLRDFTNKQADEMHMTSIQVNNLMYLEGRKMVTVTP